MRAFNQALLIVLSLYPLGGWGRTIKVVNSCQSTIWPGMHTGTGTVPSQATGWELAAGGSTSFEVDDAWTAGRIWARTGCVVQNGVFLCLTGQCGDGTSDSVLCTSSDQPPATLAEFTLVVSGEDNYDISLVDGFNVPLNIIPSISSCPEPQCQVNINALCPPLLRTSLDQDGHNLACLSSCNAGFGEEIYGNRACCTGAYVSSQLCQSCGYDYYPLFKDNCNTSYAYAYDEKSGTALWTCPSSSSSMSDYTIEFCPAGSDYVGPETPSEQYVSATATCSNLATGFSTTFSVGPSPTKTATIGSLQVVATVATGVDGAAAVQINPTSTSTSSSSASTAVSVTTTTAVTTSTAATSASESVHVVYVTSYIYENGTTSTTTAAATITTASGTATGVVALASEKSIASTSASSPKHDWGHGQWLTAVSGGSQHNARKRRRLSDKH